MLENIGSIFTKVLGLMVLVTLIVIAIDGIRSSLEL